MVSQPLPQSSRPDRTIIERRSSCRTENTSSITPGGRPRSAGTPDSPRWHRDEAAARRGRRSRLYPIGSSAVSAPGRALGAGVRCHPAAARGRRVSRRGQRFRQSRDQPRLALRVSGRADCGTARTGSVERSSPGSIVVAGGWRPLAHRIKEPWPILRGRRTAPRIAFSRVVGGNWDVYLIDLQGAVSKVTSALSLDFNPVWSPDGRQIFDQSSASSIYSRSVTDGTPEQAVLREPTMVYPTDVSPDGSVLLYTRATGPSTDLWYVSLGADRTPHPIRVRRPPTNATASFLPTASGSRINRMKRAMSKSICGRFQAPVVGFRSRRAAASKCAGQETGRNSFMSLPISD